MSTDDTYRLVIHMIPNASNHPYRHYQAVILRKNSSDDPRWARNYEYDGCYYTPIQKIWALTERGARRKAMKYWKARRASIQAEKEAIKRLEIEKQHSQILPV